MFSIPCLRSATFAALVAVPTLVCSAQSYTVAPAPNFSMKTHGVVRDVLVEPDGKIIIGGSFTEVGGVARQNLARLNADGSLDATWQFDTDGIVTSVARASNGSVYIGGNYNTIQGVTRLGLARIVASPGGPVIDSWAPSTLAREMEVEVAAGDDVFVLPKNSTIQRYVGGASVPEPGWASIAGVYGWDIDVSADGQFIATCTHDGEVAKVTRAGALVWRKNWEGFCNEIAFAPDGAVFAARASQETSLEPSRQVISRIQSNGTYDPAWERELYSAVDSFAFPPSGVIWIGTVRGHSYNYGVGRPTFLRGELYRFQANGTPIAGPEVIANGPPETMNVLPGGDVFVAGSFAIANHEQRVSAFRIASDTLALGAAPAAITRPTESIRYMTPLSDGSFLIAGTFIEIDGQPRRFLARLNAAYQLMPDTWPLDRMPSSIVQDGNGDCMLAASFPLLPSQSPSTVIRLNACATIDSAWRPNITDNVTTVGRGGAGDAAIYVASCSTMAPPIPIACRLQRFPTVGTGTIAPSWTVNTSEEISALLPFSNGMFVGGAFQQIAGQAKARMAKIADRATGALDLAWTASVTPQYVLKIVDPGDGEIIVTGDQPYGEPYPALVRLNAQTGAANPNWNPLPIGPYYTVGAVALSPDGSLYFGDTSSGARYIWRAPSSGAVSQSESLLFALGPGNNALALHSPARGELLVAGTVTELGGQPRNGIGLLIDLRPMFEDGFE